MLVSFPPARAKQQDTSIQLRMHLEVLPKYTTAVEVGPVGGNNPTGRRSARLDLDQNTQAQKAIRIPARLHSLLLAKLGSEHYDALTEATTVKQQFFAL